MRYLVFFIILIAVNCNAQLDLGGLSFGKTQDTDFNTIADRKIKSIEVIMHSVRNPEYDSTVQHEHLKTLLFDEKGRLFCEYNNSDSIVIDYTKKNNIYRIRSFQMANSIQERRLRFVVNAKFLRKKVQVEKIEYLVDSSLTEPYQIYRTYWEAGYDYSPYYCEHSWHKGTEKIDRLFKYSKDFGSLWKLETYQGGKNLISTEDNVNRTTPYHIATGLYSYDVYANDSFPAESPKTYHTMPYIDIIEGPIKTEQWFTYAYTYFE